MMLVRPVVDPAIPVEVRDALLAHAEGLRPGSGTPPPALPGGRRRAARDVVRAVGLGAVCALLPVVLVFTRMFGLAGRMAAVAGQVALAAAWLGGYLLGGGLWPGITVTLAVQLVCTVVAFVFMDAWQLRRGVRRARGHYLVSDDFDPEGRVLLARAQAAIDAVTGSGIAAAGLLDTDANEVILPRQEWEIAQALARWGAALGVGRPGRGGRDGGSAAQAVKRVEALERYAEQVREADAALSQRLAVPGIGPAAESVALAEIEDLSENARRVRDAIRATASAPGGTGPDSGSPEPPSGNR